MTAPVDLRYFAGRIEKLSRRLDQVPRMSWATVVTTAPLTIHVDGDPAPILGEVKNAGPKILLPGTRVQVMRQDLRYTVISASVDVPSRGTSSQRVALGMSGAATEGLKFYDTDENREYVWLNGWKDAAGSLLWQGAWYMDANQTAPLSEAISAQRNGIIIAWAQHTTSAHNYGWHYCIVAREHIQRSNGSGVYFPLVYGETPKLARKYLYVYDTYLEGHSGNNVAPNNDFSMREVRGF